MKDKHLQKSKEAPQCLRVIIAGSRTFGDYPLLRRACSYYLSRANDIEIVSGTALGADKLGEKYAIDNELHLTRFPANWKLHGRQAGYLRNVKMAEYADALIAFWDGRSRGTWHMICIARKQGLKVRVIEF